MPPYRLERHAANLNRVRNLPRMDEFGVNEPRSRFTVFLDERWRLVTLLIWLGACAWMLWTKRNPIHWLGLSDTDDNMRLDQVRDWLGGQGWYDLRQYRLNPPTGFDIHWSRLVDLPLAAMILVAKPLFGAPAAYRIACAVAPLLPMGVAFVALALVVRRLVSVYAYPIAQIFALCGTSTLMMWMPLRIDHHGWQLALLMVTLAGLCDPDRRRSGITVALSSALSLTIGLEMLPYVAFAGVILALHWVWDGEDATRVRAYGFALAVSIAACFLVFASNDNWTFGRCDALTPVWLVTVGLAALLLAAAASLPARSPGARLVLVAVAGGIVAAVYALAFPQCLGGRLEHIPPEAERLWLSHVREARPIYRHGRDVWMPAAGLPIVGALAGATILWRRRFTREGAAWLPVVLFGLFASALMFWQFRTAPSAQMLAVPLATWAVWRIAIRADESRFLLVRTFVPAVGLLMCSGLYAAVLEAVLPPPKPKTVAGPPPAPGAKPAPNASELANRRCPTIPALRPIALQPKGVVFTFIDAGPRLITLTHHSAVAGPYHRNPQAILDVEHAFRGTPDDARAIMAAHRADYLLVCPHMSEATIYQAEAPGGFYAKLADGWTPDWLIPIPLPASSPWRMWRLRH
jgi:hypothetical protein